MFGRLKEADLVSNREDKHNLIRGPNIREKVLIFFFSIEKGIREDFTWGDTFELHLARRGDFQTKRRGRYAHVQRSSYCALHDQRMGYRFPVNKKSQMMAHANSQT